MSAPKMEVGKKSAKASFLTPHFPVTFNVKSQEKSSIEVVERTNIGLKYYECNAAI